MCQDVGSSPTSDAVFTPGFTPLESEFNLMVDCMVHAVEANSALKKAAGLAELPG